MFLKYLLYMSTIFVLGLSIENRNERKLHRLVGGHLKIINPDPDDAELMETNASGSKNRNQKKGGGGGDEKTLSQQVADGKYGLIQKELFSKNNKKPGVLSYDNNPEVPKDSINNLGGLTKNDIWLAENHLLVVKGGTYPNHEDNKEDDGAQSWPPIDDYKAPKRPVKIPANPKVPPPFPVRLADNGPLQILGTNSSRTLNGTLDASLFALPPPEGYVPGTGPYFPPFYPYPPDAPPGETPGSVPPYSPRQQPGEYPAEGPFPPQIPLNGSLHHFFASLPPGAVAVPPPRNNEPIDEDDPSIYYPPPYSFYYHKDIDNKSLVPAGPIVPGIILPPPPDFFAPLNNSTPKPVHKSRTQSTTPQIPAQIRPTTNPVPPTSIINNYPSKKPIKILPVHTPSEINNELKPIVTTPYPKIVTVLPVRQYKYRTSSPRTVPKKPQVVTILKPVKPTLGPDKIYYYNEKPGKPFEVYGPPNTNNLISSTPVPLKAYYSTSNEIDTNSTPKPPKYHIGRQNPKPPAEYYFYEENSKPNPHRNVNKLNNYYLPVKEIISRPTPKPQFIYVTSRPYSSSKPRYRLVPQHQQQQLPNRDSFGLHIAKLKNQIHYYTTPRPVFRQIQSPKPVYQYSFQSANYNKQHNHNFRPSIPDDDDVDKFRPMPKYSVQIQPAIEIVPSTEQPPRSPVYFQENPRTEKQQQYYNNQDEYKYEEESPNRVTPRPISQYSFEATENPQYKQEYYSKPQDSYFEDLTKKHFTMFGKRIPGVTTRSPNVEYSTSPRPVYTRQKLIPQNYQQKPVSLEGDTDVNYADPRPDINPNAEFLPIVDPNKNVNYPQVTKYVPSAPFVRNREREQRTKITEAEIIKAIPVTTAEGQAGSFISYQLPGDDGAHFYFLTPQLSQSRDQGVGYYYSQPRNRRSKEDQDSKR